MMPPATAPAHRDLRAHRSGVALLSAGSAAGDALRLSRVWPLPSDEGSRFNAHKLLLDPYAMQIVGALRWSDALFGYTPGHRREDLSYDRRDSAVGMPKCKVIDPAFTGAATGAGSAVARNGDLRAARARLHHAASRRSASASRHYAGLATAPVIDYLKRLGVTTIELMPVHAFVDDRRLVEQGLRNYWATTHRIFRARCALFRVGEINEFKTMVKTLHSAGFEVILDVVYNHNRRG